MNNRIQQRFDASIKSAVSASQERANTRITRQRWAREDREIRMAVAPSENLDALIARLVARDNLEVES